jgi:hypothetical protein
MHCLQLFVGKEEEEEKEIPGESLFDRHPAAVTLSNIPRTDCGASGQDFFPDFIALVEFSCRHR